MKCKPSKAGKSISALVFIGVLSIASVTLAVHATTYNDLAPYDAQGEYETDFWYLIDHANIEISIGEASCTGSGIIDTRTYHRAFSNILPAFRTLPSDGTILFIR